LHRGRTGLAGEIGHLHTSDDGRLCECGARGCFWQTRSIPALLDEMSALHHRTFTLQDLSESAARGEPDVVRALRGLGEALGRRLADAVVFLDPDIVIVDAALGGAADAITDGIRIAVHRCAPAEMVRGLAITTGDLGGTAHVHGALALARTHGLWSAVDSTV
jgi:predicted NBD/HSP70 family sugar kinase